MTYDFRQKQQGRFTVHVYHVTKGVQEYFYNDRTLAEKFAQVCFRKEGVYKVKIWDANKGPIEQNTPNAAGLVLRINLSAQKISVL